MKNIVLFLSSLFILSGCQSNSMTLINEHPWQLISINNEDVSYLNATITFTDENHVQGFTGCNSFFGSISIEDKQTRLKLENLGSTRKLCHGNEGKYDYIIPQHLSEWNDVSYKNKQLILKSDSHIFIFESSQQ